MQQVIYTNHDSGKDKATGRVRRSVCLFLLYRLPQLTFDLNIFARVRVSHNHSSLGYS